MNTSNSVPIARRIVGKGLGICFLTGLRRSDHTPSNAQMNSSAASRYQVKFHWITEIRVKRTNEAKVPILR
jgi:hypothetical protein